MIVAFLLGFAFGLVGSIPVAGPISALVFGRGVAGRARSGTFIAIGSAVAESGYAFLAFWGFSAFLARHAFVVPVSRALAAVLLTAIGVSFVRVKDVAAVAGRAGTDTDWASFALGLSITALNPTLIATWTAVVATSYSTELVGFSPARAWPFAAGTLIGIVTWFGALLGLIGAYRERLSARTLVIVMRVMGVVLVAIASWFCVRFGQYLLTLL